MRCSRHVIVESCHQVGSASRCPYSGLGLWVKKAYESAQQGTIVVALLPMFTDAVWFHGYASHASIELLKGRLQFMAPMSNGYSPFCHGVFLFRRKSARAGKRLAISLNDHRLGTSLIIR